MAQQYQRALSLVRTYRDKIDSLSAALLEQSVVHKADLRRILGEKVRYFCCCHCWLILKLVGGGGGGENLSWLFVVGSGGDVDIGVLALLAPLLLFVFLFLPIVLAAVVVVVTWRRYCYTRAHRTSPSAGRLVLSYHIIPDRKFLAKMRTAGYHRLEAECHDKLVARQHPLSSAAAATVVRECARWGSEEGCDIIS